MNLIVLGNTKPPVGNKIPITRWLKDNLNMSHMGNFNLKGKWNPMAKFINDKGNHSFNILSSADVRWQNAQHK